MSRFFFDQDPFPFLFPHSIFDEFINNTKDRSFSSSGFPLYDVYEDRGKIIIEYALAGYSAKQLHVWTEGTKLFISADKRESVCKNRKIAAGQFKNWFEAKGLKLDDVKVTFVDGILKIELLPQDPPERKEISINTGKKLIK